MRLDARSCAGLIAAVHMSTLRTVRVVPSNNKALYAVAGKVPPLATARFAGPIRFPYAFELDAARDITPEFANVPAEQWASQDLIVSCRLDTDGVAATRDPADLVGRGTLLKGAGGGSGAAVSGSPGGWKPVEIALEGRGLTGKILTAK